ncbi:hypothetical protein ABKN59_011901 [Abortiporus biennis]
MTTSRRVEATEMSNINTATSDTKYRASTPSEHSSRGNVVDHAAPPGPSAAAGLRKTGNGEGHVIKVQPLKRSEMQPSYAQDLGTGEVTHGVYGSMLQIFGSCIGFLGAISCCLCPNSFRNVLQGSVGLVSRFGQFYKCQDSDQSHRETENYRKR